MALLKRTYSMPSDTLDAFEETVAPGKRSGVIAQLVDEWLDEQRRAKLREDIAEGCREMAEIYLEIEREFHPLEEEVSRDL